MKRIERVQNKELWRRYASRRRELCSAHGIAGANEQELFHGAARTTLEEIIRHGLDVQFARGGALGKGQLMSSVCLCATGCTKLAMLLLVLGHARCMPLQPLHEDLPIQSWHGWLQAHLYLCGMSISDILHALAMPDHIVSSLACTPAYHTHTRCYTKSSSHAISSISLLSHQ